MGTVINSGSSFNPNISASTYYGTCSTASATAAKTTTISGFELRAGIIVAVKFTNANTATSATLNVSSTGAKPLKYNGVDVAEGDINEDNVATFIYDGTNYNLINVDYSDDIDDVYSVMGQMGAKNLIPYPYYRASGYSSNGMTTTYDSDGVLTINKVAGSSTAYFSLIVNDQDYCFKPNTKYKLLFELENANQLTIYLKYGDTDIVLINKKSTGKYVVDFTTPQTLQGRENLALNAAASDTETNAKVKVMIMLASDTDNTYQPYAKTNKQLTDDIDEVEASLERFQNLYGDELHPLVNADGNHIIDSEGDHVYSRTAAILKAGNNVSLSADNTISFAPTQLTVTLLSNGWSNKTQTVSATGVTASNLVMYFPAPASYTAYVDAEIYATAQGTNSLTFTCDTVPSTNITVNVVVFN